MADTDKDILITPNTGNTNLPTIDFVGSSNSPISLKVLDGNEILFESSAFAPLFKISSNVSSGSIFDINDASGLPALSVQYDGSLININKYGGKTIFGRSIYGEGIINAIGTVESGSTAKDLPSIECTSIRFNGGQAGYVTSVQAQGHIYCGKREPDNGTGAFPFNQYGALVLQASTRSGYNNDIVFVSGSAAIGSTPSPSVKFRMTEGGNFRFGDGSSPSYKIEANGSIYASSEIVAFSDVRVKKDIKTIDNALSTVLSLRGVSYERTDNVSDDAKINTRYIGVIAQEIEEFLPEVVSEDTNGMKAVAYGNIVGLLIEAIKDLNNEVSDLKKKLEEK